MPRGLYAVIRKLGIVPLLEKRGRVVAKCPYHSPDNHPSWSMVLEGERRGQHNCLSCHEGGRLVDLVSHVLRLSGAEAYQWLRGEVEAEPAAPPPSKVPMFRIQMVMPNPGRGFRLPPDVIEEPLGQWVSGARAYLERRGVTPAQVERWGLCYAVDGRLAGRVLIPVRWPGGRPASYMARSFVGAEPRYLTPRPEERPSLDVVFGSQFWPDAAARRRGTVMVTEGALNALAVERATGFPVGALGGSDVQPGDVLGLSTWDRVVVVTDADKAGDTAAGRLEMALSRYVKTKRVRLPRDADELPPGELREALWRALG